MPNRKSKSKIEGEGSYSGAKTYDDATAKFVKDGKVNTAKEAERAMDSDERQILLPAEAEGKAGDPRGQNKQH